jgi:hypothetical protein
MACVGLGAAHFALFTRAYFFHNHFDICKYFKQVLTLAIIQFSPLQNLKKLTLKCSAN